MRTITAVFIAILTSAGPGESIEIVITPDHVEPPVVQVTTGDRVTFINRSGRVVHVEFGPDRERHQVFQVPGQIWAVFHRPGRHQYVVHFETGPRGQLHGVVEVGHAPDSAPVDPFRTCTGVTVEGACLEP